MTDHTPDVERRCICGKWLKTNDPFLLDNWYTWHPIGDYSAGADHDSVEIAGEDEGKEGD